ncbi:hypothetical protein GJ496_005932 [Pomphorhynchus laevis]|nr:hypothetical protein GJ496_005932 [Pomphorhynchus laevis]
MIVKTLKKVFYHISPRSSSWSPPWRRQRLFSVEECKIGDHIYFERSGLKFHAIVTKVNVECQVISIICYFEPDLYAKVFNKSSELTGNAAGFCRIRKQLKRNVKLYKLIYIKGNYHEFTLIRAVSIHKSCPRKACSNIDFVRHSVTDRNGKLLIMFGEKEIFRSLFKMSAHHAFSSSLIDLSTNIGLACAGVVKANVVRSAAEATLTAAGSLVTSSIIESIHAGFYIVETKKRMRKGKLSKSVYKIIVTEETVRVLNVIIGTTIGAVSGEFLLPFAGVGAAIGGGVGGLIGSVSGLLTGKLAGRILEYKQDKSSLRKQFDQIDKRMTYMSLNGQLPSEQNNSKFYLYFENNSALNTVSSSQATKITQV